MFTNERRRMKIERRVDWQSTGLCLKINLLIKGRRNLPSPALYRSPQIMYGLTSRSMYINKCCGNSTQNNHYNHYRWPSVIVVFRLWTQVSTGKRIQFKFESHYRAATQKPVLVAQWHNFEYIQEFACYWCHTCMFVDRWLCVINLLQSGPSIFGNNRRTNERTSHLLLHHHYTVWDR